MSVKGGININVITRGLIYYMDAANPRCYPRTGTIFRDLIEEERGDLYNGVGFSTTSLGVFIFDGIDNEISTANTFSSYINSSLPITFEVWAYLNLSSNDEMLLGSSWSLGGVNFRKNSSDKIRFLLFTDGSNGAGLDSSVLSSSGWYQCVATYNGNGLGSSSNFNLYVNNTSGGTSAGVGSPTSIPVTRDIYIGSNSQGGFQKFLNGEISNVKIYNRELTANEVQNNFEALRGRFGL